MKKYLVFAGSFLLLFSAFQILSGLFITYMYTPDMQGAWSLGAILPEEAVISSNGPFFLTFLTAFLCASIAYLIANKMKIART